MKVTTIDQAKDIVTRSNHAFQSYSRLPLATQRDIVIKALALIRSRKMELGRELSEQMGRPIAFGHKEIEIMQKLADYLLEIAKEALATLPGRPEDGFRRYIKKVPVGPILLVRFCWSLRGT